MCTWPGLGHWRCRRNGPTNRAAGRQPLGCHKRVSRWRRNQGPRPAPEQLGPPALRLAERHALARGEHGRCLIRSRAPPPAQPVGVPPGVARHHLVLVGDVRRDPREKLQRIHRLGAGRGALRFVGAIADRGVAFTTHPGGVRSFGSRRSLVRIQSPRLMEVVEVPRATERPTHSPCRPFLVCPTHQSTIGLHGPSSRAQRGLDDCRFSDRTS